MKKRILALALAWSMTFAAMPVWHTPSTAQAKETEAREHCVTLERVREEAREIFEKEKMAFDIDLSSQVFDGSKCMDYSQNEDYMGVLNRLGQSDDAQTLIVRFRSTAGNGFLFGAGVDAGKDAGKNMTVGLAGGKLRVVFRNTKKETNGPSGGLKASFGKALENNCWHTAAISFEPAKGWANENVRIVIDGSEEWYARQNCGASWRAGFDQGGKSQFQIFQAGGGSYVGADNNTYASAALNGQIDFLTIINKSYSISELQRITRGDQNSGRTVEQKISSMFEANTAKTWLFTGGTETVADFHTSKTTRNWVGLFEQNLRFSGSYIEVGRFVFNTGKRNAGVADILAHYEERIDAFQTEAVGILVGEADYEKGAGGLDAFKENLGDLIGRINENGQLAVILTPYQKDERAAAYAEAIRQTAESEAKVVDLSNVVSEDHIYADGTLKPEGHAQVASALKTAVGRTDQGNDSTSKNNYSDPAAGAYTIAKKENAALKVDAVKKEGAICVKADEESVSGERAVLSYVLTDERGQKISGQAESGETAFEIDGLEQGKTYTLEVFDRSRSDQVSEAYQPIRITAAAGMTGTVLEYADGNLSVNEGIQAVMESERAATWLFMGDSITHGILTQGHDNVPQLFAKYLDELRRTEDVVLNAGVTNSTIATTLDQISVRLKRYQPDVVMVMLGTNDARNTTGENTVNIPNTPGSVVRGGITTEQYKERYKQLVREIHENKQDTQIVLRVPCELGKSLQQAPYGGYAEKYASIYEVAEEMREEIPNLNIAVVNHKEEWNSYQDTVRNDNLTCSGYGWLAKTNGVPTDDLHPNIRGNLSMFQQLIRELGLYEPTSELANYVCETDAWTGSSAMEAPVRQRGTKALFAMGTLKEYADGVRDVTVILTDENGKSISKTEPYDEGGDVILTGLDFEKVYTASVVGTSNTDSREISFAASLNNENGLPATKEERKELERLLVQARDMKEKESPKYPKKVLEEYEKAILDAENVFQKEMLTVGELQETVAKIKNAMETVTADSEQAADAAKESLQKAVGAAKGTFEAGQKNYTKKSWDAFVQSYQKAQAADTGIGAPALEQLLEQLEYAVKGLVAEQGVTDPIQPGQIVEDAQGIYRYRILSTKEKTVEVLGFTPKHKGGRKIQIYSTLKIGTLSYKVTAVAAKAFQGQTKAAVVTGGQNLVKIGANAFSGCTRLKTVTLQGKKLKEIGKNAFAKDKSLKKITLKSTVLKKVGKKAFLGIHKKAVIKVPKKKKKAYQKLLAKKGQARSVNIK